jgi:hypothetical protein
MVFTLPETAVSSTLAYVSGIMTDAWVLIALAVGVPFAFYVIKKLIGLLPKR